MTATMPPTAREVAPGTPARVGMAPGATAMLRGPQIAVCAMTLWGEPDGLRCTRPEPHDRGHVYRSSNGSDLDDRHTSGGHG